MTFAIHDHKCHPLLSQFAKLLGTRFNTKIRERRERENERKKNLRDTPKLR
jgi:hypothetical protein